MVFFLIPFATAVIGSTIISTGVKAANNTNYDPTAPYNTRSVGTAPYGHQSLGSSGR